MNELTAHTHLILFQLIGVLVDGLRWRRLYRQQMTQYMATHYGQTVAFWSQVDASLVADWASYHADLNYSGQDGIADMHEGLFRTTRALFTIAQIPPPPHAEIKQLAQTLIRLPIAGVLSEDVKSVLVRCRQCGYTLGVFGYLLQAQIRSITQDVPDLAHVIGADTLNHYEHDDSYFMKLHAHLRRDPATVSIVVTSPTVATNATTAGFHAHLAQHNDGSLMSVLAPFWVSSSDTD